MGSYMLKQNADVNVEVNDKGLYTIRLNNHVGATFTIDLNLRVSIGQSSRMSYSFEDLQLLTRELEEGKQFMLRAKMTGMPSKKKPKYIKPSEYKNFTVYMDEKGRFIFYVGNGTYKSPKGYEHPSNRLDCHELYGICSNPNVLKDGSFMYNEMNRLIIFTGHDTFCMDSYSGKPRKLVQEIVSYEGKVDSLLHRSRENYDYAYEYYTIDFITK